MVEQKPDIVCLQEIIDIEGDGAIFNPFQNLKNAAGFEHGFHSPVFTFGMMRKSAHFGNGILSRFPLGQTETIFTNLEYVQDFSFDEDDYNIRNLQHAVVRIDGKEVHVLNHHGHHVREHKKGNEETMRQCQQIADYIDALDGPVILAGDFNLSPDSKSIGILSDRLRNLAAEYKLTTTRTFLTHKKEVCDYVFVNDQIRVNDFKMLDDIASDHAALLLDFEF